MDDKKEDGWHYIGNVTVISKFSKNGTSRSLYIKYLGDEKFYKVDEYHVRLLPEEVVFDGKRWNAETSFGYLLI